MDEVRQRRKDESHADSTKKKGSSAKVAADKEAEKAGRLTGFQQFTVKSGMGTLDLEAMEAAAENALADENEEVDVDEDLFDVDSDDDFDDLDDMDFDDDSDDDNDEPDI